jgi:hypothetical protein
MSNQYPGNQSGFQQQQNSYQTQSAYGNTANINNSELVFISFVIQLFLFYISLSISLYFNTFLYFSVSA